MALGIPPLPYTSPPPAVPISMAPPPMPMPVAGPIVQNNVLALLLPVPMAPPSAVAAPAVAAVQGQASAPTLPPAPELMHRSITDLDNFSIGDGTIVSIQPPNP